MSRALTPKQYRRLLALGGVGPDTTPEEALQTIENLINKRHPREQL